MYGLYNEMKIDLVVLTSERTLGCNLRLGWRGSKATEKIISCETGRNVSLIIGNKNSILIQLLIVHSILQTSKWLLF